MNKLNKSTKTGGRKKGTPNKKSLFLSDALNLASFDFIHEFTKLYSEVDANKKAELLMKLMEYCFPKRKSLDIDLSAHTEIEATDKTQTNPTNLSALSLEELKQLQYLTNKMELPS